MHDQHPWVFWQWFEADYEAELRHAANERLARQVLGPSEPKVRPSSARTGVSLHALAAASSLPSKAAVRRLVVVTLAGLRPRA